MTIDVTMLNIMSNANIEITHELSYLRNVVAANQQLLIKKKLQGQLDSILSFLGVTERIDDSVNDCKAAMSSDDLQTDSQSYQNNCDEACADHTLWSTVVSRHKRRRATSPRETFQQSVVAAVYVDQTIQKRRETSVIISGLAPKETASDSQLIADLCAKEFHLSPSIISAKRLGAPQKDKIQPLLVYMKEAEQAKQLVVNAKQLRRSTDPTIRKTVYINRNLTRAEAAAAFQVRVQKRSALQRRNKQTHVANDEYADGGHLGDPNLTDRDSDYLNPTAVSFQPTAEPRSEPTD
jgi:hypothetical protein